METTTTSPPSSETRRVRPRIEMPLWILAALLIATFVGGFQSQRRAESAAEQRFQALAQTAKASLNREIRHTRGQLESVAALVTAAPELDAVVWRNLFDTRAANQADLQGLARVDYLSDVAPAVQTTALGSVKPGSSKLRHTYNFSAVAPPPELQLDSIPAIARAIAAATRTRELAVSAPVQFSAGNIATQKNIVAFAYPILVSTGRAAAADKKPAVIGTLIGLVQIEDLLADITKVNGDRFQLDLEPAGANADAARSAGGSGARRAAYAAALPQDAPLGGWQLQVRSTQILEDELRDVTPKVIVIVGCIGSILLAGLIWLLTHLRRQAESMSENITARLRDQMKLNEDIIEFNPSPIYRKDAEGRFVAVNRAWELVSGRRREDVLGKTNREFQRPDIAEQNDAADARLYESAEGFEASESVITNAEGRRFETVIAKQVIRRADGTVDGLIGTITDLSPIKRLEREVALQREQLDLVISASQQGIWDIDLNADGNAYFSTAFRDILGYTSGGFPARFVWQENIHPDDSRVFRHNMVRHFKGETPFFDTEARARRRDGTYVWVRTRAIARHDATGRAIRFVGSIVDISDRKEAETMLIEGSSRIAEAAKAKEAFLATMSHEIRTPLNGVLGMATLLSDTPLSDEQRDYIRLIRASGDTLLRLINDVLDFSKIEAGQMTLESASVEVISLVEETFELVAEKAREKRLALYYDLREDVPYYILGDVTRLRQVLLNLLSNAIKFTERGEVSLTLRAQRTKTGKLELEGRVRDTGVGIDDDEIAKLFTPFTQADASTTRKYGGTGLGLAIVKRLTQAMNGDVRVESVKGKGATFIFTIETQQARGPLRPYMQREVFDFLGKRLLVIDHSPGRRQIQPHRYARWGFDATIVSPDEAANVLRAKPGTDIIISDFAVASPDTPEFAAALLENDRSRMQQRDQPIVSILLSSYSRSELAQLNITPPVRHDVFLLRPVGIAKLFDTLMRAVLGEIKTEGPMDIPLTQTGAPVAQQQGSLAATGGHPVSATTNLQHRQTSGAPRTGKERVLDILVAEDNEVNQRVIGGMIANLGHRITLVGDGRAAVDMAKSRQFDVVLMDIQMPILDGVAAMHEIRAHFANGGCPPIVAMTAHALAGDREGYLSSGMDDYISKPIRATEISAVLERTTGHRAVTEVSANSAANMSPIVSPQANATQQNGMAPNNAFGAASEASKTDRKALIARIDAIPELDHEQLEDLRYLPATPGADGKPNDPVGGLIRLFQSKALERMEIMEKCLAESDWKALMEVSHSLRGASASMGFPRVAALCKDLELSAKKLVANAPDDNGATQGEMDEIFELMRHYYWQADKALALWLAETATTKAKV
jgi:PAS domain S-box-containing protein